MPDHPHEEAIQLLYAASEDHPAVGITLGDQGPRLSVNTGYTDDPVEAQLTMIAGYVDWMADHTDVEPEQVVEDALAIVHEMRDDEGTETFEWDPDEISRN
jgi:hypothetical protein